MTTRDPDRLVAAAGRGDPNQDQHFLVDDRVLDRIPEYASAFDLSHVLEIGPGAGALTDRLLAVSDHVTVIERDAALVAFLETEFAEAVADGRLTILEGDAMEIDLPEYSVCISNLPYGISTAVTFRLLRRQRPAVLMFQAEVAERLVATPGTSDYGRLSVGAQHYADVEIVEPVPPEAFDPQPAVDSAIVTVTPRTPEYEVPDDQAFLDLVKALFTQRRKTVRNGIRNTVHISGIEHPEAVIDALPDSIVGKRPDALEPAEFAEIAVTAARIDA
ncbi:16S rRNA (adenine(1518)-N(6)/adenine(1519)-N(6))-dimethyltransferase RsmA [Halodesulfurarchaeum formicicum]|uniref:Probable ribosomal RNA small subunit methyltransferase A n=1 Tax=Halodesulfurarchaeum formicicum TaxID=1873524 RepID=A0A1J1ABW4_9EURY|nr:16S rRNA (adenine(1518)-N(6)/adenine(1519)-N(6))-dimethyltransferase RsmA [Halodesulfurarchaeum formicicum]APE95231.1 dimethyladenosine transferase [Halodesulfurarchaeum formicicum]